MTSQQGSTTDVLPIVALMRRFCDDFLNAHDPDVILGLLIPDYRLSVAGMVIPGGAAGYHQAAKDLFVQFPDLRVTLHEILTDTDRIATRLSIEGSSTRHGGNRAAWGGVGVYRWNGEQLTECWIEEDHHLARRQLRSGAFTPLYAPPGPADPYAAQPVEPSPKAVERATDWLTTGGDGRLGSDVEIDALLVAGDRFAFHTSSPTIHVSGMATVRDDGSVGDVSTFTDGGSPTPTTDAGRTA